MPNLVGREPNQVPTNGMLGTTAFVNKEELPVSTAQAAAIATATAIHPFLLIGA